MVTPLFPELIINGERVPHKVIALEAQNHEAPKGKPGIAWRKAAKAVAVRVLLLQEAKRRGLQPEPVERSPGRFETEEEALIRCLIDKVIHVIPPSEAELRAEWARNPNRFRSPPLWQASHILCACDPDNEAAKTEALARAVALTKKLEATPHQFAKLAKAHSDCGSKSTGGMLGQLGPGDTLPEFEAILTKLTEGEITAEPVLTRFGWHIIRLDAVVQGAALPFDVVRHKLADAMQKASWAGQARAFVNELVQAAEISGTDLKPG